MIGWGVQFWTSTAAGDRELGLWLLGLLAATVLLAAFLGWGADRLQAWWTRRPRRCA